MSFFFFLLAPLSPSLAALYFFLDPDDDVDETTLLASIEPSLRSLSLPLLFANESAGRSFLMSADKLAERELFGSSSSSSSDDDKGQGVESAADDDETSHFELLRGSRAPRGLSLHRGALDRETAKTLFEVLSKALEEEENGGGGGVGRQAFFFGELPKWALALSARTRSTLLQSGCWPRELAEREPIFNMAAVNSYGCSRGSSTREEGGEEEGGGAKEEEEEEEEEESGGESGGGLKQHVDLPRFTDGVAIFSLGASAVMRFQEVGAVEAADEEEEEAGRRGGGQGGGGAVACLLRSGDLLLLSGEARWRWTHGFGSGDHFFRGERVERWGMRIGVTLRSMRKEEGSNE